MKLKMLTAGVLGFSLSSPAFASTPDLQSASGKVLIVAPTALNGPTNQGVWFVNPGQGTYNLQNGVGLHGYDPVAIFPEGGGQPTAGNAQIRTDHAGVTYYFASEQNKNLFAQNPGKYEPTYGGWCAFAMASGSYVDVQPELYTLNGNRAHYFAAARAKRNFDRDLENLEAMADVNWKQLSGEDPRL